MILPSQGLSVSFYDRRKDEEVANGEVVRIRTTLAGRYPGWRAEVAAIDITLNTGYIVTIPRELIKELLEVTA
ncbi:hypothetical protein LCGC14_1440450 [marine sediment metagenome]|uniref:Uncharacterized protein n=1 Tax=marine sediment metagenome TaxID=412755 RepID=A0A0F9JLF0_9ZZZZ